MRHNGTLQKARFSGGKQEEQKRGKGGYVGKLAAPMQMPDEEWLG